MVNKQNKQDIYGCKNTTRPSITQYLLYIQWYICQGDMFRPSRSSSGPPKRQIQELFGFSCIVGSQMLTHFCYRNIKYISLYILSLLCDGFSLKIRNLSDMVVH